MTAPDRKGPAPDKLYADRGPRGGWMFRAERMPDTLHSYTRDDLAAAAPDLLSIVQRFVALPSDAWHPERHAAEEAKLMQEARAAIAQATT